MRSKVRPLKPPTMHQWPADGCREHFLSGRCIRVKITIPPLPEPFNLQGSGIFDSVGCRATSRFRGPRPLVRCFGRATMHLCARSDHMLSAHITEPFSGSIGSYATIFALIAAYVSSCNRCCALRGLRGSGCGARTTNKRLRTYAHDADR